MSIFVDLDARGHNQG